MSYVELHSQLDKLMGVMLHSEKLLFLGHSNFFINMNDGLQWLYNDYREVNKVIIRNRNPMPRIDNLFDQLNGDKFFSKNDLQSR